MCPPHSACWGYRPVVTLPTVGARKNEIQPPFPCLDYRLPGQGSLFNYCAKKQGTFYTSTVLCEHHLYPVLLNSHGSQMNVLPLNNHSTLSALPNSHSSDHHLVQCDYFEHCIHETQMDVFWFKLLVLDIMFQKSSCGRCQIASFLWLNNIQWDGYIMTLFTYRPAVLWTSGVGIGMKDQWSLHGVGFFSVCPSSELPAHLLGMGMLTALLILIMKNLNIQLSILL